MTKPTKNGLKLKHELGHYLTIAKDAAVEVGKYLKEHFGSYKEMHHKSGTHYNIEEDKSADDIYKKILTKKTPEIEYYSEETGGKIPNSPAWIVDAIEGTSNYRVGHPLFATQLVLMKREDMLVSVVHAPLLNLTYYASRGGGAYRNGETIHVTKVRDLKKALVSLNKGTEIKYLRWYAKSTVKLAENVRTFRNFGATGLELAHVADGKIDAHLNFGSNIYDYLPGALIIKEAGGTILSYEGKKWTTEDDYLIASIETLAKKITKIFEKS